jgi:hypothetical protein
MICGDHVGLTGKHSLTPVYCRLDEDFSSRDAYWKTGATVRKNEPVRVFGFIFKVCVSVGGMIGLQKKKILQTQNQILKISKDKELEK